MKNDNIRKHLRTKRDLTFAKVQELSLSLEEVENQAQELKGAEPIVHRVDRLRQSATVVEEQTTKRVNVSLTSYLS